MRDLIAGFRTLREAPGFSMVVILTLALGVGVNTAMFSVIYAVLLAPPPYPAAERLVQLWEKTSGQNIPVSWINFQHWRAENHTFEDMAGFETTDLTLTGRGDAMLTHAAVVSASFFQLTGWRPAAGRLFGDDDDRPGAMPVAVLSSEFGGSVGSTLNLDGTVYEIIGVLPPGSKFFTDHVDFYLPAGPRDGITINRAEHGRMVLLGRLKPGVTLSTARADLDAIIERGESSHHASLEWLAGFGTADVRPTLLILMGAVGLVLTIACVNVAGLLLTRSIGRTREIAIRTALGAVRTMLARQLLTENLVLATAGGCLGLLLAGLSVRAMVLLSPADIPRLSEAGINLRVLAFAALITLITGTVASLAPVFRAGRIDLTAALKEGSAAATAGRRGHFLGSGLVTVEIAVTLMLSFACILLLRSLALAQSTDPGFNTEGVLALEIQLPASRYKSSDAVRRFYDGLTEELRREPSVQSVGAVNCPPSTGGCARGWYSMAEMPAPAQADVPLTVLTTVTPTYFGTMRIHLLAGRGFTDADREGRPQVVVINEKIARHWWPSSPQLAVGHRMKFGGPYMEGATVEIVGVVADVHQGGLDETPVAETYAAFAQSASPSMVVMIRAKGEAARLIPAVRRKLVSVDRDIAVQSLRTFEKWMGATLQRRRFTTLLLTFFAALALTLSAVGIYGVLSHWVGVRHKEIAIRMALGARRRAILRWVGWHAMRLVAVGIVLGMAGGWGGARWLSSLVFGVSATDPVLMGVAAGMVMAVAGMAVALPMWRATRIEASLWLG
jgi:putative ABC transport system permease protein